MGASGASVGRSMLLLVMGIFPRGTFADLLLLRAYIFLVSLNICVFLLLTDERGGFLGWSCMFPPRLVLSEQWNSPSSVSR